MNSMILDVNTILTEHANDLLVALKVRNSQYNKLCKEIISTKEKFKKEADNEIWLKVKGLLRLIMKKSDIDSTYLYCQGMKDIWNLSCYVDSEVAEINFRIKEVDDDF